MIAGARSMTTSTSSASAIASDDTSPRAGRQPQRSSAGTSPSHPREGGVVGSRVPGRRLRRRVRRLVELGRKHERAVLWTSARQPARRSNPCSRIFAQAVTAPVAQKATRNM